MSLRTIATLILVTACKDPAPAPAPPAPTPAAPRPVAAAGSAAVAAAPAASAAPILLAATTSSKLTIYELAGSTLRERSSVALADPSLWAWPRADAPLWVSLGLGMPSKFGRVEAGVYRAVKLPGSGDPLRFVTTATGDVSIERCIKWGDNPDEEGCLKTRFFTLPPGKGAANRMPAPPQVPAQAAPAGVKLTARALDDGFDTHELDCTDASGTRTLTAIADGTSTTEKDIKGSPTWQWLSATPPIAAVHIAWVGGGEGVPGVETYLLRGCTLTVVGDIAISNDVWAAPLETARWTIFRGGTKLVELDAIDLRFPGGAPFVVSLM